MERSGSSSGISGPSIAAGAGIGVPHSHSSPAAVDGSAGRTPPATPRKAGKMLAVRVHMLNDTITMFQVQAKALGQVLFDQVCKQLNLLEADYFGLEYQDAQKTRYWLDLQKPVCRQLGLSLVDPLLYFCVKFYTPDPAQLEEEFTRYLFCLQIKRDLAQGFMQCNDNTAALMASYIVQAECGDYVPEDYPDHTYLSSYKFVPHQDQKLERQIMENHKKHAGQTPAEADLNLLETARRCELYGMKMHPAKDVEEVPLNLAVAHMGLVVFQGYTKINTFSWAKIRKISFKRKRFLVKLHPEGYGYFKEVVEFFFDSRDECKNFWKKCVENHGFFRCTAVKNVSRHKTRVLSRGSSFRYSGKTQKQIVEFVRDNYVKRQTFQRSASFRHPPVTASTVVGNSISAHPLLPLSDSAICTVASAAVSNQQQQAAAREEGRASLTTRAASRHPGKATSLISARTTVTQQDFRTMTSPSPPQTMRSEGYPSATVSPRCDGSPVAVRAAVHMADNSIRDTTTADRPGQSITIISKRTIAKTPYNNNIAASNNSQNGPANSVDGSGSNANRYHPKSEGSLAQQNDKSLDKLLDKQCIISDDFLSQTRSQVELDSLPEPRAINDSDVYAQIAPKRKIWQRSSSCRELYDYSFEDSGEAKRRPNVAQLKTRSEKTYINLEERKLESPITRYDDSSRSLYNANSSRTVDLEIHQDIIIPDQKIYSSSYPGTTSLSVESVEDPGNYDLNESQDDISHDSYELLERSDESISAEYPRTKKPRPVQVRSCSLDSGNYIPSDSDSDSIGNHKYKSSSDVCQDVFLMEDPRDLPREKVPRKSDGSFYKTLKMNSRTSSLESKGDHYDTKTKLSKIGYRTSSQESKSDSDAKRPTRKNKSYEYIGTKPDYIDSRASSLESKSDYYDAASRIEEPPRYVHHHFQHDFDRKIQFERNYGTQNPKFRDIEPKESSQESGPNLVETSHVHSISLQNVETEQNIRLNRNVSYEQNTVPRTQKSSLHQLKSQKSLDNDLKRPTTTHIWPESIAGIPTEIVDWQPKQQRSVDSECNIFSFDEDKIQSLQESDMELGFCMEHAAYIAADKELKKFSETASPPGDVVAPRSYRDIFMEIEPKRLEISKGDGIPLHQPIERTKSDPNSIASKQRSGFNARRFTLMHQKSIDLTPAESSDEDYLYKQIPSAPPMTKCRGSHFEMPTAEFGHFDVLKREFEGQKTKFEVPKSQFEVLGAKTQSDLVNPPPKRDVDIPYVLHKRHVMNGTAANAEEASKYMSLDTSDAVPKAFKARSNTEQDATSPPLPPKPGNGKSGKADAEHSFLFTQNIDLSKIDPITLEVDKSAAPVKHMSSPKRDITKFDPALMEAMSTKLSQIESDSPTSSKTESLRHDQKTKLQKIIESKTKLEDISQKVESKIKSPEKAEIKPLKPDLKYKRIIKPRMQPSKKGIKSKGKIRITSFSSDDESLDSDDVFGTTEATPTKTAEFSPPQTRKEMESILKFESQRQTHLQYTMSSTEIEGSPPTTRKTEYIPYDRSLDPNYQTELRRISERSISIPSSEEEFNMKADINAPVFADEPKEEEKPPETKTKLETQQETKKRHKPPLLFAHARLNLSEGSAYSMIQKQTALSSPVANRRAKSLDTPVISLSKLPPLYAFSSKDDTVEESAENVEPTELVPKEELKEPDSKPKTVEAENASAEDKIEKKSSLALPEIKRTKSQEMEPSRKPPPGKEKSKSVEKMEYKRAGSRERVKSHEESDADEEKRIKKQQMLYETAIKQTKAIKSPVKDALPVFPKVEEKVRVTDGKLEISIDTIENTSVPLEEAIIITKSPKRLDKKLTKSLEINLAQEINIDDDNKQMQRRGKSLDLETSLSDQHGQLEFDFDIRSTEEKVEEGKKDETSPESDGQVVEQVVTADVHVKTDSSCEEVLLKGTSLDVHVSVEGDEEKLGDITVLKKSEDGSFFEDVQATEPPDLLGSLGSACNVEFIDESGESSQRSDKDKLIAELQASAVDEGNSSEKTLVRVASEDESLTEVSEIKPEIFEPDKLKVNPERSRSEDTASWITIECEEFVEREDSLEVDDSYSTQNTDQQPSKRVRSDFFKRNSDQSKSSDTESCAVSKPIGLSSIERFDTEEDIDKYVRKEFKDTLKVDTKSAGRLSPDEDHSSSISNEYDTKEAGKDDNSIEDPLYDEVARECLDTISEASEEKSSRNKSDASDSSGVKYLKNRYPFEQKWSSDSEMGQKVHKKITQKLSSQESGERSLKSVDRMSVESKNSFDTESSSGSLGIAFRMQKEPSSSWRPFLIDSSGSSSLEENFLPPDLEGDGSDTFITRENSGELSSNSSKKNDASEDEFPASLNYPNLASMGSPDVLGVYGTAFLTRTLSRISERSTNSDKSSLEDDSTKVSSQSDEVAISSDHAASVSSDSASAHGLDKKPAKKPKPAAPNQNLQLQRQTSDDRRTSAEMADLSIDEIELITSDKSLKLCRQDSDDTLVDEDDFGKPPDAGDWPLPELPRRGRLADLHEMPSIDVAEQLVRLKEITPQTLPKVFGQRGSLKSQDSEQWPSPPSSLHESPVVENVERVFFDEPEEAQRVNVSEKTNDSSDEENDHTVEELGDKARTSSTGSNIRIVLEAKSSDHSSNSEGNSADDVFVEGVEAKQELRPPTALRRSTASEDSSLKPPSSRGSHSSYSDEDNSNSAGTHFEDGTVRLALKSPKRTHSSHSEDTSICLSVSEWTSSANTVRVLSSKSNDNSITELVQSLSEWSSSNSKGQSSSLQFQKLSSTSTGDSTLTDRIATISEWSTSDSSTLVPQQVAKSLSDTSDSKDTQETVVRRPPALCSDNEKSTESSSMEQRTVQKTSLKHQPSSKSTERPIKVPLKLSKCSPYYSSSLSSESAAKTPTSPATFPGRGSRKAFGYQSKSPPSENDSTSSMDSPDRSKGHKYRRRHTPSRRYKDKQSPVKEHEDFSAFRNLDEPSSGEYYFYPDPNAGADFNTEEGYYPSGDSQSGSDIFRTEGDDDRLSDAPGPSVQSDTFDLSLIPPPILDEDDFGDEEDDYDRQSKV